MPNQATAASRLTVTQAASESKLARRTILYAIERGDLKAEKMGGAGYVIRRTAFERYLANRAA